MSFTSDQWILIIGALALAISNIISSWFQGKKLVSIAQDTKVVLGHVNSKETKLVGDISARNREIEILKTVILSKDKDKELLAQAVAQAKPSESIPLIVKE